MPVTRPRGDHERPAFARGHACGCRRHRRPACGELARHVSRRPPRRVPRRDVVAERRAVWDERLGAPPAEINLLVAEQIAPAEQAVRVAGDAGAVVGFGCAFGAKDERFGTELDNLHVRARPTGAAASGPAACCGIARWCLATHPRVRSLSLGPDPESRGPPLLRAARRRRRRRGRLDAARRQQGRGAALRVVGRGRRDAGAARVMIDLVIDPSRPRSPRTTRARAGSSRSTRRGCRSTSASRDSPTSSRTSPRCTARRPAC